MYIFRAEALAYISHGFIPVFGFQFGHITVECSDHAAWATATSVQVHHLDGVGPEAVVPSPSILPVTSW